MSGQLQLSSFIHSETKQYIMFFYIGSAYCSILFPLHLLNKNKNIINAEYWVPVLSKNQQKLIHSKKKTICLYHQKYFLQNIKNRQSAKIYSCKVLCHVVISLQPTGSWVTSSLHPRWTNNPPRTASLHYMYSHPQHSVWNHIPCATQGKDSQ